MQGIIVEALGHHLPGVFLGLLLHIGLSRCLRHIPFMCHIAAEQRCGKWPQGAEAVGVHAIRKLAVAFLQRLAHHLPVVDFSRAMHIIIPCGNNVILRRTGNGHPGTFPLIFPVAGQVAHPVGIKYAR